MTNIIQRIVGGVDDKGILLGDSSSLNSEGFLSRKLSFGSNWNGIRIGILCAMQDYPSQSYNRYVALAVGLMSGSKNPIKTGYNAGGTGFIATVGAWGNLRAYSPPYPYVFSKDTVSGSFFSPQSLDGWTIINGTFTNFGGNASLGRGVIPIVGYGTARKGIILFEITASATGYNSSHMYFNSSSVFTQNSNRNITSNELIAALTGSTYPPSASGILMGRSVNSDFAYDKTTYPMDTAFLAWYGTVPLEIYDWYIYKST